MSITLKNWLMPFVGMLVATGAGLLLIFPMVNMEPREIPIAVANLDGGISSPAGQQNAGEIVVEKLKESSDDSNLVAWKVLDTQSDVTRGFEQGDFYAAIVIPEDFTKSQVAAKMGQGEVSPLQLTIDAGKNPMVTSSLQPSLEKLSSGMGVAVTTEYRNAIPSHLSMVATMLPMMFMILAYIGSYASAIILRKYIPLGNKQRVKTVIAQLAVAVGLAFGIGLIAAAAIGSMKDLDASFINLWFFTSLSSFALMTIVLGSLNWLGAKGMIIPIGMLLIGLGTSNLPYEFLPDFWQQFVYPWMPLRFIAEGIRSVLFQEAGFLNAASMGLVVASIVGVVGTVSAVFKPDE